ncbi:MAG TPA: isoleucine--tRNA ligase [Gemmatimonadaceae bacterium]|nr:isoleucine--tRNA ligase [Gemmatimonadaceae bacterium]
MTAESTVVKERYRRLPSELSANALEQELLERWSEEGLMEETLRAREGAEDFVFFEGPPTANGRPGIHHVFARTVKDLFCRYRAMKGYRVLRKAGWDTHGLPVEIEVEKQLGISGKQQIEEVGVAEFNRLSRESVWRYKGDWEALSARIGYWLDYSDPYITYSNDYVESVWWALSTLFERDLLYRGHKILPYCPRCGTALSSHEVAQGYEDVKDPSVYVALELQGSGGRVQGSGTAAEDESLDVSRSLNPEPRTPNPASRRILVWTTTPWTLVSNVALAVNPELEYVEVRVRDGVEVKGSASVLEGGTLILAASRAAAVLGDDWPDRWEVVERVSGSALAGLRYRRPLDWVKYPAEGEHEVIVAESFVSAEDGSGVVHMAPAFGADDYAAGQRHGLAFVQPVDARGEFPASMPLVGGMFVKKADPLIIEELKRRGVLWKSEIVEHSYPHCWRCGTPLLYYARESWFVRTTAFRDGMLARNGRVDWHPPETGSGRFGEWLKNNIDWALSRDRYWGTPLPLWVCDRDSSHVEAVGSYERLAERWGRELPEDFDPHKPYIDVYAWPCAECARTGEARQGMMRRTPEVIDTWFDSGSMPFAQWHFPFERRETFASQYPADFIAEGVDQTRGWFYSLLAIATGLGDALPGNVAPGGIDALAAPYRSVVVNDLVLDATGAKMSKSRGNAVDPWTVIDQHGADAVRLFLIASSQVWMPRRFDEDAIRETAGRFLNTLKQTYSGMFAQYANFGWEPSAEDPVPADRPVVDRWVLSRLATVEHEVDELLWRYEATLAVRLVMDFLVDDVSNWYVRLNRPRFYDVDGADNRAAFATLHEVLVAVCRMLAPFAPFITDWIHRELTGTSVHLAPFATPAAAGGAAGRVLPDPELERAMSDLRRLATLARAAREVAGVNVRQPLSRLVCVVPNYKAGMFDVLEPLLRSEINVKALEFASSGDSLLRLEAKPNFRSLGRRFGKRTPLAAAAVSALSNEALAAHEKGEPLVIGLDGESHELSEEDFEIVRRAAGELTVQEEGGYVAAIDPTVTPELRREGIARELVNRIQRLRKEARFAVSDRIRLQITGGTEIEQAAEGYKEYIAGEVLASEVMTGGQVPGNPDAVQTVGIMDETVSIALTRVHN